MKTHSTLLALLLVTSPIAVGGPLTGPTAVHSQPSESAPTIAVLKAGSEATPAPDASGNVPAGWMAVSLPGPFDGYVQNRDIMKSLDVRTGAPIHVSPKPDATVLTTMEKSDKTNITGLHGKWTQISLQKTLTGYIHVSGNSSTAASSAATSAASSPMDPAPVTPVAYGVTTAGRPAPMVNLGDGGSSTLPRLFQGKFVSTRNPFRPRRPYEWALNDDGGERYAFLDMTKLLLTEQLDKYIDHHVVVYGAAKAVPGRKDIVIEVESLQLK